MTDSERDARVKAAETKKNETINKKALFEKDKNALIDEIAIIDQEIEDLNKKIAQNEKDKDVLLGKQEQADKDIKLIDNQIAEIDKDIEELLDADTIVD